MDHQSSKACSGCGRLPSLAKQETFLCCGSCKKKKLPDAYFCGVDCPGWNEHILWHKELKTFKKSNTDDGQTANHNSQQYAMLSQLNGIGNTSDYQLLLAAGLQAYCDNDMRKAIKYYKRAIQTRRTPYSVHCLGIAFHNSGHFEDAARCFVESSSRYEVGTFHWADAQAATFDTLRLPQCVDLRPDWWNDEALKALSSQVIKFAPEECSAHLMRGRVLSGRNANWANLQPRSIEDLRGAAYHFDRAAELVTAPRMQIAFRKEAARLRE